MCFSAKKNKKISVAGEFAMLQTSISGPFFSAKKTVSIHEEFQRLVEDFEKFEKNFKTPCIKTLTSEEKSTEKITKKPKIVHNQIKIDNIFKVTKPNPKKLKISL